METTKFIWMNGKLVPWEDAKVHVLTHGLHYGSSVFEGVRCYKTPKGPAIFRLKEHVERLVYSASAIRMKIPYSIEELMEACRQTVRENAIDECYIRPVAFYGYGKMGLNPIGAPTDVAIACWPWGAYLGGDTVRAKISEFMRIHPRTSVTDAKIGGHYVNSIMASLEVHDDDRYDEAIFLDFDGYVAEGPGENIFLVKDGALHTPLRGTILPGITRDSIIAIAHDDGMEVIERAIKPDELYEVDECFFTGTAAEVSGIVAIDDRKIGKGTMGPITKRMREEYLAAAHGERKQYEEWLTLVRG